MNPTRTVVLLFLRLTLARRRCTGGILKGRRRLEEALLLAVAERKAIHGDRAHVRAPYSPPCR